MSIQEDVLDFIRKRAIVEIVRSGKDERLYSPENPFSRMGISERGAVWIAGEVENQFGVSLNSLLRQNPLGKDNYCALKPEDITKYIIRTVN